MFYVRETEKETKRKMGQTQMRIHGCDLLSNGYKIILFSFVYLSFCSIVQVGASIHEYHTESFIRRSNSFFFHGGSEGLYASKLHSENDKLVSEDKPINGKSFIR